MHWYDKYIKEYKQYCLESGWKSSECDGNCEWCDEFQDDFADYVGANERVWPYDYRTQEEYEAACAFADDADGIVSDEEVRWWNGDPGYARGISSPAVDPRDFASREEYEDALYRHLFEEAVSRHAVIPNTDFWLHTYVKFLKDAESVFCADKSILALLDELNYCEDGTYVHLIVPPTDELEREIRYSSWKKPRIEPQRSRYYSSWYYRPYYSRHKTITRYRKTYTEEQFRNDLFHHYPELLALVNGVMHRHAVDRRYKPSQMEKYIEEYLPDVLISAFYMHDMFGLSVEECIQNGLEGLLRSLKNGLWDQNTPRWMWNFDKEVRREQYVLWEMRLHMIQYSLELADYLGFTMNRKASKIIEAVMFERKDLHDLSADDFSISYEDWEVSKFCAEQIRGFFNAKNPIGLIPPQDSSEEYLDCADEMCRTCAIDLLRKIVQQLPDRERNCLVLRYGLESGTPMTLEEIGEKQWITKERVRQIERKAIELLKKLPGYADLCELTGNPIPKGAKHLPAVPKPQKTAKNNCMDDNACSNASSPSPKGSSWAMTQEMHTNKLEENRLSAERKTIEDCGVSVRLYIRLRRLGIIYVDQLLELDYEQLQELPPVRLKYWHEAIALFEENGVKPSEAMRLFVRPYRPPTNLWIDKCGFPYKFERAILESHIVTLDYVMGMSVSELKEYTNITPDVWYKVDRRLRELGIVPSEAIMELAETTYD